MFRQPTAPHACTSARHAHREGRHAAKRERNVRIRTSRTCSRHRAPFASIIPGQRPQRLPRHPARPPVRQHVGAQLLVEADRRRVPVEHVPVHAAAAARDGQARPGGAAAPCQSPTRARAAGRRGLRGTARASEKRREVVEEQREAHRGAVHLRDDHFGRRTRAEQLLGQQRLGGHDLVLELLVRGQLADEPEDESAHRQAVAGRSVAAASGEGVEGQGRRGTDVVPNRIQWISRSTA